ncbi:hypothetical protein RQP46_006684 [Phenoliferia psychrophenolica]
MASIKVASLFLKTLAKPLANRLKTQAKENPSFRRATIAMAQFMHRNEMNMRIKLLGEDHPKHIRPLNDTKAIDAGANFLSEAFLFGIATAIIIGESWRSSRKEGRRRDLVAETLEEHETKLRELNEALAKERKEREEGMGREKDLQKVVDEVVQIGLRGGWLETPSAGWEAHVRLSDAAREFGKHSIAVIRSVDGEESESAVLKALAKTEGAGWDSPIPEERPPNVGGSPSEGGGEASK